MKTTSKVLGLLGLLVLGSACSGVGDEPAPLPMATDLGSRLATDLGCPTYVSASEGQLFVAVQGESRVIAPPTERGIGDAVKAWATSYATDIFAGPDSLRVVGEGRDASSAFHVMLASAVPENVDASGYGIDLTLDSEGRLLGLVAHKTGMTDFKPALGESQAIESAEKAIAALGPAGPEPSDSEDDTRADPAVPMPAPTPTAQLVLMPIPGGDGPVLAYRVDVGARSVWVDAGSGAVLSTSEGLQALRADAKGWRAYSTLKFNPSDWRRRVDYETTVDGVTLSRPYEPATLTQKSKTRIVAKSLRTIDPRSGAFIGEPIAAASTEHFDVGLSSMAANKAPAIADGLAVDAVAEIENGERYFQGHLFASPSRRLRSVSGIPTFVDEPIEIIVHANHKDIGSFRNPSSKGNFRNNAAFVNGTTQIIVGDGDAALLHGGANTAEVDRSPALSTDVMAHELTHMWIDGKPPAGEARSIHEGISDVIGQFVEHDVAVAFGTTAHPERFGEASAVHTHGERYLARPDHGLLDADHSHSRECLLKDASDRPVLDSRGQPRLDPAQHADLERGNTCDHVNATVVGHAFFLMTLGGKNARSKVVVRNPIGWEVSQAIWLASLVKVPTSLGFRALVPSTLLDLAQQQLAGARVHSVAVANAVGCAWEAVGVLDQGTTAKVTGIACTAVAPIDCSKRPDGIYCDELNDFSATRCQGGAIGASPAPCPTGEVCRPRGGMLAKEAELVGGKLACYLPRAELR